MVGREGKKVFPANTFLFKFSRPVKIIINLLEFRLGKFNEIKLDLKSPFFFLNNGSGILADS